MPEKKQYLLSDGAITLRRYFSLKYDPELFLVVWESNSDPEREIQVGLCAYKNRVAQVDIPQDTPGDDVMDILNTSWYIIPRDNPGKKCPPIKVYWECDDVWIAACEPSKDLKPFGERIREMTAVWEGEDLIEVLRRLGPGECVAVGVTEGFESEELTFFIGPDGRFVKDGMGDADTASLFVELAAANTVTSVVVTTQTSNSVCIHDGKLGLKRVPEKEVRGFRIVITESNRLKWEKIDPATLRRFLLAGRKPKARDMKFVE